MHAADKQTEDTERPTHADRQSQYVGNDGLTNIPSAVDRH